MIDLLKAGMDKPLTVAIIVQAFSDRYSLNSSKLKAQFDIERITVKSNPLKIAKAIAVVMVAGDF